MFSFSLWERCKLKNNKQILHRRIFLRRIVIHQIINQQVHRSIHIPHILFRHILTVGITAAHPACAARSLGEDTQAVVLVEVDQATILSIPSVIGILAYVSHAHTEKDGVVRKEV